MPISVEASRCRVAVLGALLLVATASAQQLPCGPSDAPGATLLLPYFEVDAQDDAGRTTLFSVGNASEEATLAHAVVWTNWGHPVMSFDFVLGPRAVQSFNVRDVLRGQLPSTELPQQSVGSFPSCTGPLEVPEIDSAALQTLLTGQPNPDDGLCWAGVVEDGALMTGSITVDVVQDCSGADFVSPRSEGYWGDCATGLAGNDNVLWGDFFLVDPAENSAQGERLPAFVADQTRFGVPYFCVDPPCGWRVEHTFQHPDGNRMPLRRAVEARFLRGGGFDGGTELLVWVDGRWGPAACDANWPNPGAFVEIEARTESGDVVGSQLNFPHRQTSRLRVGHDVPMDENFGVMNLRAFFSATGSGLSDAEQRQLWVLPLVSANGRFSVGMGAVPAASFCE